MSSLRPLIPYLRQSRVREVSISIEEQERDVRAWANANGEPIAEPLIERGVSGSKGWRERELGRAVEACRSLSSRMRHSALEFRKQPPWSWAC